MKDQRIVELEELAQEEGIVLPYPADYILFLEDSGRIVDLVTGEVIYAKLVPVPTSSAQAVAYLLGEAEGEVAILSAYPRAPAVVMNSSKVGILRIRPIGGTPQSRLGVADSSKKLTL